MIEWLTLNLMVTLDNKSVRRGSQCLTREYALILHSFLDCERLHRRIRRGQVHRQVLAGRQGRRVEFKGEDGDLKSTIVAPRLLVTWSKTYFGPGS